MVEKGSVRLTQLSSRGGCAAKWSPGDLKGILAPLVTSGNEGSPFSSELLVGFETSDDAAVLLPHNLTDSSTDDAGAMSATVLTVDFLTPLVDDPYDFGRIAATNALSDVYAMGATPVCALNLLALDSRLGAETARDVLRGGADAVAAAGALIVGGHSIDDPEPKYGLCVMGRANPRQVVRNAGALPGDLLYLTKPLGTGILAAAYKVGAIDALEFQVAIDSMKELNDTASVAMLEACAHAATDVTGFGLAGHLLELLTASGVSAELSWERLPLFPGALVLSKAYCRPSRTFSTLSHVRPHLRQGRLDDETFDDRMGILCDPQTSGGLLVAVAPEDAGRFETTFEQKHRRAPSLIGRIVEDTRCTITFDDAG